MTGPLAPWLPQDSPGIFSAGLDLMEMCGRDPAHYAEYWKAVQELWLRLYLSHLVLICAVNVSVPSPILSRPADSPGPAPGAQVCSRELTGTDQCDLVTWGGAGPAGGPWGAQEGLRTEMGPVTRDASRRFS